MEKEFKESEIISNLKKEEGNFISLYTEDAPRKIGQPDEKLTTKAYNLICDMWNKTEKSRNFLKYLIHEFLPIRNESKVISYTEEDITLDKNRCCVLRTKLAGIEDIMNFFAQIKINPLDTIPADKWEKIKKSRRDIPIEVKNSTIGYISKDGNKYLSGEALVALQLFVNDCIKEGEKEISRMFKKKNSDSEKKEPKKKEKKVKVKTLFAGDELMDDKSMSILKSIKENLEK